MNIIDSINTLKMKTGESGGADIFSFLTDELKTSLQIFWEKAGKILLGSGVSILDPPVGFYSLENNFFSVLFLYSYYRAGIKSEKRILYSAINQCLRGMVTGCDNILDDEYKRTIETSLPQNAKKFRSVLDIMVSDHVLFELFLDAFEDRKSILALNAVSLKSLIESGFQEASEEGGIAEILPPDRVLDNIHHYKTGILFNCPWAVPSEIENINEEIESCLKKALYNIGMGCQIMDDMADLEMDIRTRHHNYVVSLIYHESSNEKWEFLKSSVLSKETHGAPSDILTDFSEVKNKTVETARSFLTEGLNALFDDKHKFLVEPAISFLSMRIGVDKYF
jgi:hypothetical protein